MKPLILKCSLLAAAAGLTLGGLTVVVSRRGYGRDPAYISAVLDKQDRLEGLASPKLLLVGGSNLVFSQDSGAIGRAIGRAPVNLGLHASIGLSWMLAQAEANLKKRDLAVVIPEYEHFVDLFDGGATLAEVLLTDPRAFQYVRSWRQLRTLPEALLPRLETNLFWLLKQDRVLAEFASPPWYRRSAFDETGDNVAPLRPETSAEYRRARDAAAPGMRGARRARLAGFKDEDRATAGLLALMGVAERAGAGAVLVFPCVPGPFFETNREGLLGLEARLKAALGKGVLGSAADCVLPPSSFFDSDYHLAPEARKSNTARLVGLLK